VLCNTKGDVLYASGRSGKYLEPTVGKAHLNIFAMAREGLRYELSRAFAEAQRENRLVNVSGIKIANNGGSQLVNLSVQRLTEPKELEGTVIVLIGDVEPELPEPAKKALERVGERRGPLVKELESELQRAREQMQTFREEMQTSQEELKSTNEE